MVILYKTNESQLFHFQSVPTHVWVTLIKERLSKEDCISKVRYTNVCNYDVCMMGVHARCYTCLFSGSPLKYIVVSLNGRKF